MADGKPASATIFYLPDQYRPFPLLIAGEVFLFLVIRRNPLPPNSPGTPPQFRPALAGALNKINHRNNQWREAERGLEPVGRGVKAPTLPLCRAAARTRARLPEI